MLAMLATTSLATWTATSAGARQIDTPESLHSSYLADGRAALLRTFTNRMAFNERRQELLRAARSWREEWVPSRAAMLLETAVFTLQQWTAGTELLEETTVMVISRPGRPGADRASDDFERTFHRLAISTLTAAGYYDGAEKYVARLAGRLSATAREDRIHDPRLALIAALIADARTAPVVSMLPNPSGVPSLSDPPADLRRALIRADAAYQAASGDEVAAEARIRRAFVLHRLGQHQAALDLIESASPDAATDPDLAYWGALIRGRVLEHVGRADDAHEPYATAVALRPQAQTGLLALASWLARHGRAAEAETAAARARVLPATAVDPWWTYWNADVRFIPVWLEQLRQVRP
jgi:tetratricopeptide (TPR) repeat protein